MSYDLKYQSDFYNYFHKKVSVQIYKKDYGVHDPILVRTDEVVLQSNYQDEDTAIIGTGIRVGIRNEGSFNSLEDLLTSTEREFLCVITYDSTVVFQGYSICDLNEQQFSPYSKITLQFTDYLRRLDSYYSEILSDMGGNADILALIQETIQVIGLDRPLYVNSTLFETRMTQTDSTFLEQTYIENNILYSDTVTYDNTYDALNRILKSFDIYLYSLGDKWVMERLDDVVRTGTWIVFNNLLDSPLPIGSSTPSLQKSYNKQDDDFKYTDLSQIIEYDSGLKTLIVALKDNQLATFVFNNFTTDMLTVDKQCRGTEMNLVKDSMILRTWYIYYQDTVNYVGTSFRTINQYMKWSTPPLEVIDDNEFMGVSYEFEVAFNVSEDSPTILSVSFKMAGDNSLSDVDECNARFVLMFVGGPSDGYYMYMRNDGAGEFISYNNVSYATTREFNTKDDKKSRVYDVNVDFNLTDPIIVPSVGKLSGNTIPSVWSNLGKPAKQKFMISFLPLRYTTHSGDSFSERVNYLGDIATVISQQKILNSLTYYINKDFMKTVTEDIDFFDLDNVNFSNGLFMKIAGLYTATASWETYQYDPQILMDIYARVKFGNYSKTLHKLKGTILFDGLLKPFSILTDDNLMTDSSINMELLLHGYSWDIVNGTYDIVEAVEYTDATNLESSDTNTTVDPSNEIPAVPTGLSATLSAPGSYVIVTWTAVLGATGYVLQRMPYSPDATGYVNNWTTIYTGSNTTFNDNVQNDAAFALLDNMSTFYYKVSAYNANGISIASAIASVSYYKIANVLLAANFVTPAPDSPNAVRWYYIEADSSPYTTLTFIDYGSSILFYYGFDAYGTNYDLICIRTAPGIQIPNPHPSYPTNYWPRVGCVIYTSADGKYRNYILSEVAGGKTMETTYEVDPTLGYAYYLAYDKDLTGWPINIGDL